MRPSFFYLPGGLDDAELLRGAEETEEEIYMAELIDSYGRRLNYVRISVTDRCNFRCSYCMPESGVPCIEHSDILRYEDIFFLCNVFWGLGVRKFRFTGGEPLVRKGLIPFLGRLRAELPEMKLALTTNASLLGCYAEKLAQIGINSLNISLDTLVPRKFTEITRVGSLNEVINGIRSATSAGIKNIKLNTVLIKGFNDGDISCLLSFAKKEELLLRLIEFMPIEEDVWSEENFIGAADILKILPDSEAWRAVEPNNGEDGPARYYVNEKTGDTIGVIEAVSNHFCVGCNRLRISASGSLRTCLFGDQEIALRDKIKERDEVGLRNLIVSSVREKPRCWGDVRSGKRRMSHIGG